VSAHASLEPTWLEWDTTFFGTRIASLAPGPRDEARLASDVEWCRRQQIACAYALSAPDDAAGVRALERHGARFVDVRVTHDLSLAARPSATRGGVASSVRSARAGDVPALAAIAAVSHVDSRFYADDRFPRERCDRLYATWLERSVAGWADAVLVAEDAGAPVGYITCHSKPDAKSANAIVGSIGLIAVAESAQGRGLGRALVHSALAWFQERGVARASVVTQGRNVGAQRLYQSCGFRTASLELWHHLWLDSIPERP
jgi:dTDP-4-amino-4,6-dideoxy-D-galactose acyltransferase